MKQRPSAIENIAGRGHAPAGEVLRPPAGNAIPPPAGNAIPPPAGNSIPPPAGNAIPYPPARLRRAPRDNRMLTLLIVALTLSAGAPALSADALANEVTGDWPPMASQPELYFNLVYCGSGRPTNEPNRLREIDWPVAARRFGFTIIKRHVADYRRFASSVRRQSPDHTIALYLHAHGLFQHEDRAGGLNLREANYLHATDPADLRVTPVPDGLLVDWATDERWSYDSFDVISEARRFIVSGYVLLRGAPDEELQAIAKLPPEITVLLDSTAAVGVPYRYRVETITYQGHHISFSNMMEATRTASDVPALLLRDVQRAIGASIEDSIYPMRVRLHAEGEVAAARLRIDRNVDRDFDDPGETVALELNDEGWLEAITELDVAPRPPQNLRRILGFPYKLEFDGPDGTVSLPARGLYLTSVNNRVRNKRHGFYLMRADADEWLDHLARSIRQQIGRSRVVSAIFLDELIDDLRYAADAEPIEMTTEGFRRAQVQLLDALHDRYPSLRFYYNGAGEGTDPPASAGGMIEGFCLADWFRGGSEPGFAPPAVWSGQMESALQQVDAGRELLLLTRSMPVDHTRARLFALASFHLVRGTGSRFCYLDDSCGAPALPEWQIDLGAPREQFRWLADAATDGPSDLELYRRRFEHGEVWINPDRSRPQRVKLAQPARRLVLSGDNGMSLVWDDPAMEFEIAPQSGAILVRQTTQ